MLQNFPHTQERGHPLDAVYLQVQPASSIQTRHLTMRRQDRPANDRQSCRNAIFGCQQPKTPGQRATYYIPHPLH